MNAKQKKWADWVLKGKTPAEAYSMIFPNASKKTAANKGAIWGRVEGMKEYLDRNRQKVEEIVNRKLTDELSDINVGVILTFAKKRELLAKIASGELTNEKIVVINGEIERIKCPADLTERMKAIEIDNKMSGENVQAKPNQVAKAQEVEKIVVVEDGSNPIEQNPNTGNNQEA